MNKIKTFPLRLSERFLNQIGEASKKTIDERTGRPMSKIDFIIKCICEGIEKTKEV